MNAKKNLGNRIKKLRLENGLSQQQLGNMINKSHAAVSDIERGKTDLSVSDLILIANKLKSSITYILNLEEKPISYSFTIEESYKTKTKIEDENNIYNITSPK